VGHLWKVANFNLLHLHLVPPLGMTRLSFAKMFGVIAVALFAWSYV